MSQNRKTKRLPKEVGEFMLQEKLLKDAKKQNGIWVDTCSEQHVLETFRKALNMQFLSAIMEHKDRALLEKLSSATYKDFNTVVLEFVKKNGGSDWDCTEEEYDDITSANAYADLAFAFLEPEYEEITARTMAQHYAETLPKQFAQIQKYEQLIQDGGSTEDALECLRLLFAKESSANKMLASLFLMGYEATTKKIPLPFCTIYDGIRKTAPSNPDDADDERSPVEDLFESFDWMDKSDDSSDDIRKPVRDYRSPSNPLDLRKPPLEASQLMKSKYFQKYLRKRREKMCEILGCTNDELAKTLYTKGLWRASVTAEHTLIMDLCYANSISPSRYISTFFSINGDEEKNIKTLDDDLIPSFYYNKLRSYLDGLKLGEIEEEEEEFTKRYLYVEFGMGEIEDDIAFFSQYKYFCTFAKMLNFDKQSLYRFFDFGQKKKGVNIGYLSLRRELEKCQDEINERDEQIALLKKKNKAPIPKAKNSNEKYLRSELAKAEKENDNLIDENLELKNKIRQMEEYISAVENSTEEREERSSETKIDEVLIRSKRIVFVCGSQNVTALIKKEFPGSAILENETQTATRKDSTDLVVYFTQHIPHKMFYRFKSDYRGVPDLYYSGSNFDTLKQKICEVLKEEGE